MRFLTRAFLGVFLLAVTGGLIALAGGTVYRALEARWNTEPFRPPAREQVVAVNTVTVEPTRIEPVIEVFGQIDSARRLELRVPAGGRILFLSEAFRDGGVVEQGQVLLRLDPFEAQAALSRVEADLEEAVAEAEDAERALALAKDELDAAEQQAELRERALTRQQGLSDRGVGSSSNVEEAELNLASAQAQVLAKRQALANAEARIARANIAIGRAEIVVSEAQKTLDETELTAPFAGLLDDVSLEEGKFISANERLGDLVDPAQLEVTFRISTAQYARLLGDRDQGVFGRPVRVALEALGLELLAEGVVTRESVSLEEGQTGRKLIARLGEAPGFRPGDFVSVQLTEPALDAVASVPAAALGADGAVLALGEESILEAVPVTVLRRQGDAIVIDTTGVGDREIVAERTPVLGAGIRVRAIAPPAEGEAAPSNEPEMVELEPDRRARLVAFVEANPRMPAEAKARVLDQLKNDKVPVAMVERIESRMGG